jgi:hypothetical protein
MPALWLWISVCFLLTWIVVYEAIVNGKGTKKAIRDVLTLVGLMWACRRELQPRPLGYLAHEPRD